MNSQQEAVIQFVQQVAGRKNFSGPLTESTELIQSQILDSVNLVKLILLIQEQWNLEINFNELNKENFKDIATIRETIDRLKVNK